jgi:hypothetical protein
MLKSPLGLDGGDAVVHRTKADSSLFEHLQVSHTTVEHSASPPASSSCEDMEGVGVRKSQALQEKQMEENDIMLCI